MKIAGGVLEVVRRATPDKQKPLIKSRTELKDFLKAADLYLEFKKVMWDFLRFDADLTENTWNAKMESLVVLLKPIMPDTSSSRVREFLAWSGSLEPEPTPGVSIEAEAENVFLHRSLIGEICLRFDSIHGVKGETHAATLVVETFTNTHDLKSLLPILTGSQNVTSLKVTAIAHCKKLFVGVTRPSDLVCLAISADHIKENEIELLKNAGWNVEQLT